MTHWSDKYLGKYYDSCSHFVEVVKREVFNRDYTFISSTDDDAVNKELILREMPQYSQATEKPSDGDLVLMSLHERTCHVGLYTQISGESYVVHFMPKQGVFRHRLRMISFLGYTISGVFKWI